MSFDEITKVEYSKFRSPPTMEDIRSPAFYPQFKEQKEDHSLSEEVLHHSITAHIIFISVYLVKVAYCRPSIEIAFFDCIILAGCIWPKPKDPAFNFFLR
jgi:hypothetical protein